MYDRDIINRKLAEASRRLKWEPVYHTIEEVEEANDRFRLLFDEEAKEFRREFTPDEVRWIQNERRLCALDFHYWSSRYAKIIGWDGKVTRFVPNVAQQIILDVWAEMERNGLAIMMMYLKARQLGVTTIVELAVGHRTQFVSRTNAVVASADPDKTFKMATKMKFCWDNQPFWLMPKTTKISKGIPVEFAELNSGILFQAGNQFNGVARGDTPNVFHGSEICEWPDPAEQIDSSLLRAIHETPDVFLVLESTALGRGDWWHKTYKQIKVDWPLGRSRLCPVFLPWFVGTDIYPPETDLRSRPVPKGWKPSKMTMDHAHRAYEYTMSNPLMFKYLAKNDPSWSMPIEQLWYYEIERDSAIKKKALNKFLQEMPADDQEAFQSTNISAIDSLTLMEYRNEVREPYEVYAITGPGIPPALVPPKREWVTDDPNRPVVRITCRNVARGSDEVYKLIPQRFEGYNAWDPSLKLLVWEPPQEGEIYGVGVDTSEGVGEDNSTCQVLKAAGPQNYDTQVAEFTSAYVKAQQLWPMALAISCYYSVWDPRMAKVKQCRVAIECRGNGESVQLEMQKRGWKNFHLWKRYDNKVPTKDASANKIGVYTNQWFRSQMMDMMLTQIEEHTLLINSPFFVDEMDSIERDEKRQSMKAAYGEHDDRFMALGFILFSLHVEDRPHEQFARRNVKYVEDHMESRFYPTWQPPAQAQDRSVRQLQKVFITKSGAPTLGRFINRGMPRGFR